ncbi:energy-coupling factor transporter transmembrane protein EcfT [Anaerococcus sp. AGMB00486]|uniref:Energy-coupling factor transporter transmembrane protein EcfT n=2 Tax=Anaerococcus TaxID=165779 RepID=A0ABX2N9X4_9FIRM|nr:MULTISPECIES: energy-coupling factor transporter transmembrane component T [Anaerococcus]MDY3005926.1 energy-coupling factor transporter transmembrane component T [Anaerococcus porci]MSS77642.1 energy-coupling factor transporter transmembrane protein EcfT [Anaerococcus porci]NVF11496.1 energy-coupling factor transporter transmembrane protein EcfT [Anaerococcus faecalis]
MNSTLGYIKNDTPIHRLSGTTKLMVFILLSIIVMTTFDTRYLFFIMLISLITMKIAKIKWEDVSFLVKVVFVFSLINIIAIYIFEPEYGVKLYGSRNVIFEGIGRYSLTAEQLFYEFNVVLKYFSTIPLALIFILTTDPSEFSSSLNRIGISYKISYAVALALRYIPDIQNSYYEIRQASQARGIEMSSKVGLIDRVKESANIVMPLIFDSLGRIETIAQAMELRRFGKNKTRTWYRAKDFSRNDFLVIIGVIILLALGVSLFFVNDGRFYNPFL